MFRLGILESSPYFLVWVIFWLKSTEKETSYSRRGFSSLSSSVSRMELRGLVCFHDTHGESWGATCVSFRRKEGRCPGTIGGPVLRSMSVRSVLGQGSRKRPGVERARLYTTLVHLCVGRHCRDRSLEHWIEKTKGHMRRLQDGQT